LESIDIVQTSVVLLEDFGTDFLACRLPASENFTLLKETRNCAH
jgi:hypothetical protein